MSIFIIVTTFLNRFTELDNSATVVEAIANARKVRIDSEAKVHFSDRLGNAVTIESLNGSLEVLDVNASGSGDVTDKFVVYATGEPRSA